MLGELHDGSVFRDPVNFGGSETHCSPDSRVLFQLIENGRKAVLLTAAIFTPARHVTAVHRVG